MADAREGETKPRRSGDQEREARSGGDRPRGQSGAREPEQQRGDGAGSGGARTRPRLRASEVALAARDEIHELTGRQIEGVTSVQRGDNGWRVGVEVVESHRIPDTTDILAVYEADIDESGELAGYRRVERYSRGKGYER